MSKPVFASAIGLALGLIVFNDIGLGIIIAIVLGVAVTLVLPDR
ncbi:hypothetical protein [Pararhizobium haloflavum]|nr:hypothetical protein [Pararhizobium haloflavum]